MKGARAKSKAGFQVNVQKQLLPESDAASLAKKLCLDTNLDGCAGGRKSAKGMSTRTTGSRKKRNHGGWYFWCVTVFAYITSSVMQVGSLPKFLDQWRSITSKRYVLNTVKGHHHQLRCCPLLFCNYRQFNIKAALAHHPIIYREVDELLAKGTIDPSLVVLAFTLLYLLFLSTFVVYYPYSTLSSLIAICTYLFLRCQLLDRYGHLFNWAIMLFLLMWRMLIYTFLLLSITITFYVLFGNTNLINRRFCPLGWLWPQGFFLTLNPYCYFAIVRVFMTLFI